MFDDRLIAERQVQPLPSDVEAIAADGRHDTIENYGDGKVGADAVYVNGGLAERRVSPLPLSIDEIVALRAFLANDAAAIEPRVEIPYRFPATERFGAVAG